MASEGSADAYQLRNSGMFARTKDAIEAHLTVVFTALAVAREAQTPPA